MFKPTWIISIVIVIAVILGGLYLLPVHKITIYNYHADIPTAGAIITIDDQTLITGSDGKVTFQLTAGVHTLTINSIYAVRIVDINIDMFGMFDFTYPIGT